MSMRILVVSTSLNSASRSRVIAKVARGHLEALGAVVDWVDLQEHRLPFCDGRDSNKQPVVLELRKKIEAADGILMAAPVYNYDLNAASKNLIELTGAAWTGKVVALAVSAGGQRSGMSPLGTMNSLMLDFRCIVIPRFVYASRADYTEKGQLKESALERVHEITSELVRVATALA